MLVLWELFMVLAAEMACSASPISAWQQDGDLAPDFSALCVPFHCFPPSLSRLKGCGLVIDLQSQVRSPWIGFCCLFTRCGLFEAQDPRCFLPGLSHSLWIPAQGSGHWSPRQQGAQRIY